MMNTVFPYYPANIETKKPLGNVTLLQFIKANKSPSDKMKKLFVDIREASDNKDEALKASLKSQLYYFTPSVQMDGLGRSYSNITKFMGLLVFEFDKISFAKELKQIIFDKLESCICAYLSPSKKGAKFIVRIPVVNSVEEYKEYYFGLAYYFEHIKGFDPSNQNSVLPLYISHDPDLLYREDAKIWDIRGEKINSFQKYVGDLLDIEAKDWQTKKVINQFINCIRKIDDNAHPQVVAHSMVLGGSCAASYVDQDTCYELIENCIGENEYMMKNTKNYIRTAKQMFLQGMKSPLYMDCDK